MLLSGRGWPGAVLALGMGLAACGGAASPTVAHLGSTTTTAATASGGRPNRPTLAQATRYAACMRAHGVPGFPDPSAGPNGSFGFRIDGQQPGTGPSQIQTAQNACSSFLPNHGVAPPLSAAEQQDFLNWAACIRTHGMPNFPDPVFSGGGVQIRISAPAGGGNVGGSASGPAGPPPQLQAAQKACQSKLPAGLGKLGG